VAKESVDFRHKIGAGFQCTNRNLLIFGKRCGLNVGALGGLHPSPGAAVLELNTEVAGRLKRFVIRQLFISCVELCYRTFEKNQAWLSLRNA
jgi:hypothetical protein